MKSFGIIINGDRQQLSLELVTIKSYGGKSISSKCLLSFVQKVATVSKEFVIIGS